MSQYSKAQEARMEERLDARGFELVDFARRKTHSGDRVMKHKETGVVLTIDHKSTIGKEGIRVERKWFDKIAKEAGKDTVPCITFSFKGHHKVYIAFDVDQLREVMNP